MPLPPKPDTKIVVFNGIAYYKPRSQRYFTRKLPKRKTLRLHRDVWEFYNGPIPDGRDIHHIDRNPENNDLSNLECLTKSEHGQRHQPRRWRACAVCGVTFTRKDRRGDCCSRKCASLSKQAHSLPCARCGSEFSSVDIKAMFCSPVCGEAHRYANRGAPRRCAGCGVQFLAKHKVSKFCTRSCSARHRVEQRKRAGLRPVGRG